jgi:type VI secretion system protein ImpF
LDRVLGTEIDLKRDLENLLNTRTACISRVNYLPQLQKSLLDYGIANFAVTRQKNQQLNFCQQLQMIIKNYEPRFKEVIVRLSEYKMQAQATNVLHLYIEGYLFAKPETELMIFMATFNPATRHFYV